MNLIVPVGCESSEIAIQMNCKGKRLFGIIHGSKTNSNIGVVMVVGGRQFRVGAHRQFVLLARHLASLGIPVIRFDARGMGDSDGEPRYFLNIKSEIDVAISTLVSQIESVDQVVLWGLCDGASASISVASANPTVQSVVMVNPWITTEKGQARTELKHYYLSHIQGRHFWTKLIRGKIDIVTSLKSFFGSLGRSFGQGKISDNAIEPSLPNTIFEYMSQARCPINLIFSSHDMTAREFEDELSTRIEDGRFLKRSNLSITHIDADHTFSNAVSQKAIFEKTREWIEAQTGQRNLH